MVKYEQAGEDALNLARHARRDGGMVALKESRPSTTSNH